MPLPSSGAISLSQVNTELGRSATAAISLGETAVRNLFGVASGAISMSQGYGKANQFTFTIASNQTNANLRTLAVNAGWNQSSQVVATINSGVYISSNSTGIPALTINGSFPGGVQLINNGFIVGMGGAGGKGAGVTNSLQIDYGSNGSAGGTALLVSVASTVTNNGTIAGGGGGGGGGQGGRHNESNGKDTYSVQDGGGGGGGGRSSAAANSSGGAGGRLDRGFTGQTAPGGGAGTLSSAGGGGVAFNSPSGNNGGNGGGGGGWGASGAGGGSGSALFVAYGPYSGGGGGAAVSGNGNISWTAFGTRLGGIG